MKKLSFLAVAILAGCWLAAPVACAQCKKTGKAKVANAEEQVKTLQAVAIEALR